MKLLDLPFLADITAIRRDIHAHPELCFEENRTSDVVAGKLTEWGIPVHRGMGTTGVVGIVKHRLVAHAVEGRACKPGRALRCVNAVHKAAMPVDGRAGQRLGQGGEPVHVRQHVIRVHGGPPQLVLVRQQHPRLHLPQRLQLRAQRRRLLQQLFFLEREPLELLGGCARALAHLRQLCQLESSQKK